MSGRDRRGARWRAIEGATIVLSILLALLLDALWDYRGDRAREREYLTGLRQEFEASARELAQDDDARGVILARVERLLEASRNRAGPPPRDSLGAWTASTLNYRFYTPAHSVLEDLISSGSLGLIRSDSIRRLILVYEQARDRLEVAEERERAFIADELEPHLARSLRLDDYLGRGSLDMDPVLERPPPVGPYRDLLADPTYASLLLLRWERTEVTRLFAGNVGRTIERLLVLLADA